MENQEKAIKAEELIEAIEKSSKPNLEEMLHEYKKQNLEAFIAEVNQACVKYKCKLVAQIVITQGMGIEAHVLPANE